MSDWEREKKAMTKKRAISEFRKQGYSILLKEDSERGGYTASILEFPGCISEGDTAGEACTRLYAVAESWIATVESLGQNVPPPLSGGEYSGRALLRMPKGLHSRLALLAEAEGVSLNSLIISMLSEASGFVAGVQRGSTTVNLINYHLPQPDSASLSMYFEQEADTATPQGRVQ